MDDLISRQEAIDLINVRLSQPCKNHTSEFVQGMEDGYCRIRSDIKCLLSAQPEIIRCKDCVNHVDDRCLVANHHTGDNEYCTEVFGAKRRGEQP